MSGHTLEKTGSEWKGFVCHRGSVCLSEPRKPGLVVFLVSAYQKRELEEKLEILRAAVSSGSDEEARNALMITVPTFHTPDEVNGKYYEKPLISVE